MNLSDRQEQVIRLVADGKTYKQIAAEMGVAVSTVRTHMHHILQEAGASNASQAVVAWMRATTLLPAPPAPAPVVVPRDSVEITRLQATIREQRDEIDRLHRHLDQRARADTAEINQDWYRRSQRVGPPGRDTLMIAIRRVANAEGRLGTADALITLAACAKAWARLLLLAPVTGKATERTREHLDDLRAAA